MLQSACVVSGGSVHAATLIAALQKALPMVRRTHLCSVVRPVLMSSLGLVAMDTGQSGRPVISHPPATDCYFTLVMPNQLKNPSVPL